jgi:predicted AAA+ superfamily ATPase
LTGLDRLPTRVFRKEGHVPAKRLSMRKLREFLRLHFEHKPSARAIARSLSISPSTAQGYVSRIRVAGLSWPLLAALEVSRGS